MSLLPSANVDLNQYGFNSLRSIKEDGVIVNMADVQDITLRPGTLIGRITISASATALRIGSADLTGRHCLMIINDASDLMYINTDSASVTNGFLLNSGTGIRLNFDPNDPVTIWSATTENETNIVIWELK